MQSWICVRTQPHRENLAKLNIERQGLQVFYPRILEKVMIRKKWVESIRPLFPSYLFVRIVNGQWYFLLSTFGVRSPILCGSSPEPVADRIIECLRRDIDTQGYYKLQFRRFKFGQRVEIKSGPMMGQLGIYQGMTPQERVRILLSWFGANVMATVSADSLKAAA